MQYIWVAADHLKPIQLGSQSINKTIKTLKHKTWAKYYKISNSCASMYVHRYMCVYVCITSNKKFKVNWLKYMESKGFWALEKRAKYTNARENYMVNPSKTEHSQNGPSKIVREWKSRGCYYTVLWLAALYCIFYFSTIILSTKH